MVRSGLNEVTFHMEVCPGLPAQSSVALMVVQTLWTNRFTYEDEVHVFITHELLQHLKPLLVLAFAGQVLFNKTWLQSNRICHSPCKGIVALTPLTDWNVIRRKGSNPFLVFVRHGANLGQSAGVFLSNFNTSTTQKNIVHNGIEV